MALALYRKYRPATFAELVGQEHVTEPLRTALAAGRINHAYLFSGPRGCGKTSSARILARSLNCVKGPTPDPCGQCPSCIALAPEGSGSIDVVELDAASHGGVDDARDLRDRAFYAPADSRYRVFIIDEAHMVTTQGFNALLKIVEEPPEHLVFIFATTEPDKVLPTIRSRTHHYPFRLLAPGTLRRLLERICAEEGVTVEPSVFPLVVRAGGGSARDSLSVLDQLLAGAGADGVRYDRAIALLGVSDSALIDDVVDGLAAGDGAAVFGAVERLVDAGHDPRRFASDLLERFRDLTLLQALPDAAGRGLVDAPQDAVARMSAQADRIPPAALARYGEVVHNGLVEMRGATAPRLLLELLCARMLLPAASADNAALLHRLELLERRLTLVQPAAGDQPRASAPGPEAPSPGTTDASRRPAQTEAAGGSRGQGSVPRRRAEAGREAVGREAAGPEAAGPKAAGPKAAGGPSLGSASLGSASAGGPSVDSGPGESASARPGPGTGQGLATEPAPAAGAGGLDAAAVRRAWPDVLDEVRGRSRVTQVLLSGVTVQAVDGDTLVLMLSTPALAKQLTEERHAQITDALHAVLGGSWRIRWEQSQPAGQHQQAQRPEPAGQQRPSRRFEPPARTSTARNGRGAVPPAADDSPPPEPPDADPEDDEDAMLAEAATPPEHGVGARRDLEEAALELLADELGARKIDER